MMIPCTVMAHGNGHFPPQATHPNKEERTQWFREMRDIKHKFLAEELNLTKKQQDEFFPLYDQWWDENQKLNRDVRQMEKHVYDMKDKATDLEYEKATDALYEVKLKEYQLDEKYRAEFSKILNSRQMFLLKGAERKFTRDLMDRHQKMKSKK